MAGYTRQSTYTDGDIINASDSNDEYNQLLAAFVNTTGHKHDGTAAEGPVIGLIGDPGVTTPLNKVVVNDTNNRVGVFVDVGSSSVEQLRFQDGVIVPVTNNDIDLGTNSIKFKDGYFSGNLSVDGNITLGGDITLGDSDTDSITLGAEVDSHVIPNIDGTYDLGTTTKEWRNLYLDGTANIDSLVADTADINGGTIDGATIATSDITVGSGKTLNVSAGTLTLADNQISGDKVEGGTINAVTVNTLDFGTLSDGTISVTAFADEDDMTSNSATLVPTQQSVKAYVDTQIATVPIGDITSVVAGTGLTGGGTIGDVTVNIDSTVATLTGTQTLTNKTLTSPAVNTATVVGGTINNAVIGGSTPAAITGTTVTASTNFVGDITGDVTGTVSSLSNHDTADLAEGTNLYYTQARFDSAFTAKSTTNLSEGTNLYYTSARSNTDFDTRLATKSTTNLSEGTNLYYTDARFNTAFGNKTTSDLTENTNLYYTDARANTAIDARVTQTFVNSLNVDAATLDGDSKATLLATAESNALALSIALG